MSTPVGCLACELAATGCAVALAVGSGPQRLLFAVRPAGPHANLPAPPTLVAACPPACRSLEEAVFDEAGHEEECTKEHVVRALLRVDLDMTEKTAQQVGVRSSLVQQRTTPVVFEWK